MAPQSGVIYLGCVGRWALDVRNRGWRGPSLSLCCKEGADSMAVDKARYVACILVMLIGATARADLVSQGTGIEGNSWGQLFSFTWSSGYDLFAGQIVSGGPFESPTHRNFSDGSWSNGLELGGGSPYQATASGSSTTYIEWEVWFSSDMSDPVTWDFVAFDGDTLTFSARATWNGSFWDTGGTPDWNPTREQLTQNIPLPTPVLLGVAGLAGMVPLRRRLMIRPR